MPNLRSGEPVAPMPSAGMTNFRQASGRDHNVQSYPCKGVCNRRMRTGHCVIDHWHGRQLIMGRVGSTIRVEHRSHITDVVVQPLTSAGHPHRSITLPRLAVVPPASFTPIIYYAAFACMDFGQPCGGRGQQAYPPCCQGYVCHIQGGNMYGRCLHSLDRSSRHNATLYCSNPNKDCTACCDVRTEPPFAVDF